MRHIDGHCHFFNIQYAFREAILVLWHSFIGRYPYDGGKREKGTQILLNREKSQSLLKYVASLAKVAFMDAEKHYKNVQDEYQDSELSENDKDIVTVPLMMDIYYIFDKDDAERTVESRNIERDLFSPEQKKQFRQIADSAMEDVLAEVTRLGCDTEEKGESGESIDSICQGVVDDFFEEISENSHTGKDERKYYLSKGYEKHMDELEDLTEKHKEYVIPFLAVDPRRYKIIDLVKEKVGQSKPFKGIKLYPALGYLPTHPNLFPIYDFCLNGDIPITVHASTGGLPSYAKSIYVKCKYEENLWYPEDVSNSEVEPPCFFGNPENWRKLLEAEGGKYKNLRLNFGHFGGNSSFMKALSGEKMTKCKSENWTKQIIDLMDQFENVYADLSYCTSVEVVSQVEKLIETYPVVGRKAFFGTDYIMIMLKKNLGGLKPYFNHFKGLPQQMLWENCRSFLGF